VIFQHVRADGLLASLTWISLPTFPQVALVGREGIPTHWREFFLATPKVALATEYLLPDGARLLTVNVHYLNFERWGTLKLRSQLTVLK
jgi:endonuclease/exonuclease/phosphatase (EEP) superfamily protein YafD